MIEAYEDVKKYLPGLKLEIDSNRYLLTFNGTLWLETTSPDCMKCFCVGLMTGFIEALKQDQFTIKK